LNGRLKQKSASSVESFPIIAILGPRQSGKTTLSQKAFPGFTYVSLEDLDFRDFASNDPRGFLAQYPRQVIIDEIQRVPELMSYLQTHVDKLQENGSIVITGSHNFFFDGANQPIFGG
jgi:predicted AAA+ superfamily ATPase